VVREWRARVLGPPAKRRTPNAKRCHAMATAVSDGAARAASDWLSGFAKIKPVTGQSPLPFRYAVTTVGKIFNGHICCFEAFLEKRINTAEFHCFLERSVWKQSVSIHLF
jgi:hypothetical protein